VGFTSDVLNLGLPNGSRLLHLGGCYLHSWKSRGITRAAIVLGSGIAVAVISLGIGLTATLNDGSQTTGWTAISGLFVVVTVDHLHQDFLGVLQTLEERWLLNFKVKVTARRWAQRHSLHWGSLGIDEGDLPVAAAQDELRGVLEYHLDNFVTVAHKNSFWGFLPLLNIGKWLLVCRSDWRNLGSKIETQRLELRVTIEIAFEVLEKHNLLVDSCGVLEEVVVRNQLWRGRFLVLGLASFDVVEVK
jgi:hypothetical protein